MEGVRSFLQSFGSVCSSDGNGKSQLFWPSLESRCTAGTRVELPHINCASDHRWTYPSCGQQSMVCGHTLTTNCPSFQLLHPIYCIPLLTASQYVFTPLRPTSHTTLTERVVAQFLEAQARGFDSRRDHLDYFIKLFLPATLWPWGRLRL
jgi:hypothetical protein